MIYISKYNKLPEAVESNAYWVKGDTVYDVEGEGSNHVNFIITHPDKFDLESEWIKDLYTKNNEPFGSEGKTRELIIKYVSESGWIRVRRYHIPEDYWSIQCDRIRARRESLKDFVLWAIENKVMDKEAPIVIVGYLDSSREIYDWRSGGAKEFLMSEMKKTK
jgi:hypothetical protein